MMLRTKRNKLKLGLLEIFAIAVGALYIYPVFLMFNNSLKTFREVIVDVIALPSRLAIENFSTVVKRMNYGKLFMNNLIITFVGIVGIVFFSAITAYILDRTRNRYTKFVQFLIITPM